MKWQDEGILLTSARFGEKSQIISLFTQHHGRHKGLFKNSRQQLAVINSGAIMDIEWHARLEDHLGSWKFEPLYSPTAWILSNPKAMNALLSAIALCEFILPEREPHPLLYASLKNLINTFQQGAWFKSYVLFELDLIAHSGFPLNLEKCAVSGSLNDLVYVSPRTGRAVSREAGLPYHDRLLTLPSFIICDIKPDFEEIMAALDLTEYFLERYSLGIHGLGMPQARVRFKEQLKMQQKRESV